MPENAHLSGARNLGLLGLTKVPELWGSSAEGASLGLGGVEGEVSSALGEGGAIWAESTLQETGSSGDSEPDLQVLGMLPSWILGVRGGGRPAREALESGI